MSDISTRRMIAAFESMAQPTMFFTGMFGTPPENYYNGETVELDIQRSDEDVAVVVEDLSTGYRMNTADLYSNKEFTPPIFKEAFPIKAPDMIKRQPGQNPFEDPSYQANAMAVFRRQLSKVERKIMRAIELQASQILQTGIVTLINSAGTALYTLDFAPKSTHFPTVSTAWDDSSPDIYGDILSLCEVVRDDGLVDPDQLIFGTSAFEAAVQDTTFIARFESRRADLGRITPIQAMGNGGQFRGILDVGNYQLEIWTYNGKYKHIQTGTKTAYMDPAKVICRATAGRLDATYGGVPMFLSPEQRLLPFVPPRLVRDQGAALYTNAWVTNDGEQLFGGISARPLLIPTAIDTFGCLDSDI